MKTEKDKRIGWETITLDGQKVQIGRDPRRMSEQELREIGHEPKPVLRAIRDRCLDCCAGQVQEVRYCPALHCPSWPFRMGTNPWRSKNYTMSEEHKQRAIQALEKARKTQRPVNSTD